ncbi:MAG: methyltransferase domain-containing protein [Planctomycetota bacterium]|jgi:SAM-dependent methyltransferase
MTTESRTHKGIQQYYGQVIQSTEDLQTSACCTAEAMPLHIKRIVDEIEPEILDRFYGCGSPIPPALDGCTLLDLGCGSGRDAYICSRLVGAKGQVIGVDMTEAQLDVANRHRTAQAQRFGYATSNVAFHQGYMEELGAIGIEDDSVDVVISNCVINLAPDKHRVFSEIFRVLKPGGELFFSDVFADRRLPASLMNDHVLVGECLAGAMYTEDFRRMLLGFGVPDYRIVASRPMEIHNPIIAAQVSPARFYSSTIRAFKLDSLEDRCEDYGQVATYQGQIPDNPNMFALDMHHEFVTGKPVLVCGNTAAMLTDTRFARHFTVDS